MAPPRPAISFSLFPLLPPELRLKIYSCLALPRTIEIGTSTTYAPVVCSGARPPISFSVCQESRNEAKRAYTLYELPLSDSATVEFWIDFARDTLYLNGDATYLNFCLTRRSLDKFSRIALSSHLYPAFDERMREHAEAGDPPGVDHDGGKSAGGATPYLPALTEITFVSDWLDCEGDMTVQLSTLESVAFNSRRPLTICVARDAIQSIFEAQSRVRLPVVKVVSRKGDLKWKRKSPRSSLSRETFW